MHRFVEPAHLELPDRAAGQVDPLHELENSRRKRCSGKTRSWSHQPAASVKELLLQKWYSPLSITLASDCGNRFDVVVVVVLDGRKQSLVHKVVDATNFGPYQISRMFVGRLEQQEACPSFFV